MSSGLFKISFTIKNTMKVVFIYPDVCMFSGGFQHGIGFISAILKEKAHQVSLIHLREKLTREDFLRELRKSNAELVAFSSVTNQFEYVPEMALWAKEEGLPVIIGGIHATLAPEEVIRVPGVDFLCVGEGEYAMLELVNRLDKGESVREVKNIWSKADGKIRRNNPRGLVENLDSLPFPDRKIFDYRRILREGGWMAEFMVGRGCPFDCTYCCNHALKGIYKGNKRYVRMRSVENVIEEIRVVTEEYSVRKLNFHDDTFTLFPKWVAEFCEAYKKEFDLPFQCNIRADTVDAEMLKNLRDAGCEMVRIGVETGNEWLRFNVLNRKITNRQIVEVFEKARELNLKTYSFNMVGLPYETPKMAEESLKLNERICPDYIQVSIFYPYPGTKLYELCEREGMLLKTNKRSYFEDGAAINSSYFPSSSIEEYYKKFKTFAFEVYMRSYYPHAYPIYTLLKLFGEGRAEKILKFSKRILVNVGVVRHEPL